MTARAFRRPSLWIIRGLATGVGCIVLNGCSLLSSVPIPGMDYIAGEEGVLRDRKGDYLEAEVLPRIEIPSQYDSYIIDDLMVIPAIADDNQQAFLDAPRPRPFGGRGDRGVVIQRMNDQSWIVVDASPSEVWPRIRDYWTRNGIQLAFENPTSGTMDTSWFVLEGNDQTKEKIRVQIEPGFQNDSAEIRLLHLGISQALPVFDQVNWPEKSTDPSVEYDFLSDLSNYLADVAGLYQASSVSFLAENIDSRGKASIVNTPAGRELLRLEAGYDRCWAAIGRALDRAGVEIVAQDVEQGVYEVDYVIGGDKDDGKPGFFKKVITLNGLIGKGDGPRYYSLKVQVLDVNGEVEVLVDSLDPEGGSSADAEDAQASLLRLIRNTIA